MTTRKHKKRMKLWVMAVPFALLFAFLVTVPENSYFLNRWYMLTTGSGRQQINVKKNKGAKLTLEEYIDSLEEGMCYEAAGYLITRQRPVDGTIFVPSGCESYVISPDNTGCYIITGKKKITKIKYLETV